MCGRSTAAGSAGLSDIKARGAQVTPEQVEERRRTRGAGDLAEIVYTSGTTGRPKGCMLSHGNIVANARNCMQNDGFARVFNEHHSTLLFLPLSHSYAQVIQYGAIYSRTVLGLVDMADAVAELPAYKPTAVLSVPRLWEKAYNSAKHRADAEGHGKIFAGRRPLPSPTARRWTPAVRASCSAWSTPCSTGSSTASCARRSAARCSTAWSAAAPLGTRLGHFFRGCGINVLEGYGLTETSPATNSNTPDAQKIGTVGRPIPGCTIRIAPDGEVLVKGHMVFQGYWNNEAATKEMIDEDGWLHTGDIGVLDDEGFLAITGRKKDLIITAAGKNVAPAVLEDRLRAHWLVSQCLVVGDAKPYIAVLVAVDPETFAQWKADNGKPETATMEDLRDDADLRSEIQAAVDDANKAVSHAEAIKKFAILAEDFTEAGGQLTPTLKVRRNIVMEQYATLRSPLCTTTGPHKPAGEKRQAARQPTHPAVLNACRCGPRDHRHTGVRHPSEAQPVGRSPTAAAACASTGGHLGRHQPGGSWATLAPDQLSSGGPEAGWRWRLRDGDGEEQAPGVQGGDGP